jgi:ribosomal protein S18 acetylase RimI-like enzyme
MQAPALRLAVLSEATPIAIMSRALVEQGLPGWSWNPQRVERALHASETSVLVAAHGHAIGGVAIMQFGDAHAHLSLLAVLPSQQRKGLGRRMLAWLEESALVAGIEKINLELRMSNHAARAFYVALGFVEAARLPNYYQGCETALRMTRDIRRQIPDRIR